MQGLPARLTESNRVRLRAATGGMCHARSRLPKPVTTRTFAPFTHDRHSACDWNTAATAAPSTCTSTATGCDARVSVSRRGCCSGTPEPRRGSQPIAERYLAGTCRALGLGQPEVRLPGPGQHPHQLIRRIPHRSPHPRLGRDAGHRCSRRILRAYSETGHPGILTRGYLTRPTAGMTRCAISSCVPHQDVRQ